MVGVGDRLDFDLTIVVDSCCFVGLVFFYVGEVAKACLLVEEVAG